MPPNWGGNMRRARYGFEPNKEYFAWVVAAQLVEMPSVKRCLRTIKVTLATPFVIEGKVLRPTQGLEAVIWIVTDFRSEKDALVLHDSAPSGAGGMGWVFQGEKDALFLLQAGVQIDADSGQAHAPSGSVPQLACRFGGPEGRYRYQPLVAWRALDPGSYPVDSVVVGDEVATGLLLDAAALTATRRELTVKLGASEFHVLKALDMAFPRRVPVADLIKAVDTWDRLTGEGAIRQTVNTLKAKLTPLGFTIPRKQGSLGWCLVPADKV